ncbi:MAG TPA: leucine-rich repeat domain-containing protein [Paludibacter sp.]|nr:leucine-rich repeat domain-containing protein [Paludibacter sp.]
MKKTIFVFLLSIPLFLSCSVFDDLPDPSDVCSAIEDNNFRDYCYDNFDLDSDTKVSTKEAKAVKSIIVSGKEINSLQGIQYFPALTKLDCSNNNLTALDLQNCRKLTYLDCRGNTDLNKLYLDIEEKIAELYKDDFTEVSWITRF